MSLQFILGNAGSGKSYTLYQELIASSLAGGEETCIAIVPEQFTMETQKTIVALHPRHSVMDIDIVSFERLAYRVFEEQAIDALTVLDDMGKSMLLRRAAEKEKRRLRVFGKNLKKPGFIGQLKSMLSELYQYGIGNEDLEELFTKTELSPLLRYKLQDLSVLYQAFSGEMGKDTITKEELLAVLCRLVPKSALLKDSVITLDGFTGFTPIQYRLLELLLRYAKKVIITVTVDPGENPYRKAPETDLFHLSKHTICKLCRMAEEAGVAREKDIRLEGEVPFRFKDELELAFMEKNILRYREQPAVWKKKPKAIHVIERKNPAEEAAFAAAKIHELVRKKGYRYSDMAVVTGDMAGFAPVIAEQFRKSGIPFFMDDKRSLMDHPLVTFLRSALDIIEQDFSYETVFCYLKTGMSKIPQGEIDELENYCLAMGIRGFKKWSEHWEITYKGFHGDIDGINAAREAFLAPLIPVREVLKNKEALVRDFTKALTELMLTLSVQRHLEEYRDTFAESGQPGLAGEYDQSYPLVLGLFDEIVSLLGEERLSVKEYGDILDAGFEEIRVGLIPSCVDRLVVGDMDRTRLSDIKVLFFLGFNDGLVPKTAKRHGILSENDREALADCDVELSPTARQDGFIQRFYFYLTVTRPGSELYITFGKTSQAGKALRPSAMLGDLRRIFPELTVESEREDWRESLSTRETARRLLIRGLREYARAGTSPVFEGIYDWFFSNPKEREELFSLVEAAFYSYQEEGLGKEVAKALYGGELCGSVTRLEQFAACAYAHFLTYGLELAERREYGFAAADMGTVFHHSIESFFRRMGEEQKSFDTLTEADRKRLVKECVEGITREYGGNVLGSSARNAWLADRMTAITDRTVWALGEQIKAGSFYPAGFEVSFSAEDTKSLRIALGPEETMRLTGRIDRMDVMEDGEQVYIRIVDYKSGSTSFDLVSVYYGLQLQLVFYMDAAAELLKKQYPGKEIKPGGILYYHIGDPVIEGGEALSKEAIDKRILEKLEMNGLVSPEAEKEPPKARKAVSDIQFDNLRRYVRDKVKDIGNEILSGRTAVNPYRRGELSACTYCRYRAVCGFDSRVPGFAYHKLKELKPEEIWGLLAEGEEK